MNCLTSLTLLLASASVCLSALVKAPGSNFELLILHNNDMHARFEQTSQLSGACTTQDREAGKCYGGFPRVAHVVKEARRAAQAGEGPPVLYLNAGDTYTGTAWFTIYKWKIAAEFINALQPDAVSLGNHEFDNGVKGLTPFIESVTCPVLCANLVLTKEPELARENNLRNSIVFNVTGHKVGVIGYLTPETKLLAVKNNVEYIDEIVALKKEVKKLQNEGVNIIIALGHSGYSKDLEIAKEVEGLDLVIGGHTNTFLWNGTVPDVEEAQDSYPTYVTQSSGRSVLVVQAYAYTKYFGKLLLTFNSNGEVIKADGLPILLDLTIPQDSQVLAIVEKYQHDVLIDTDTVVGSTSVILDNDCKQRECNLGNLITDAMVYYYAINYVGEHWTDAPIAIMPAGGIRTSIAHATMPSNITKGDLLGVMPFEGNLTTVTMNGTVLLKMLEHAVSNYESIDKRGEFLQLSGIKVVYNVSKPAGSRVVKAEARCWACDVPKYFKVEEKEIYKVITIKFMANGGDGFWMLQNLNPTHLGYSELVCTQYYSLGNHEFDEAVDGLIPFIRNLTSPVLAANLKLEKVPELDEEVNLYKSIVLIKNGIKIGIIGYLTAETKLLTPKNNVEYEDEIPALKREVKKLKSQGVNILIALGHSGFVKDLEIAKYVDDLDLVIGGHSNTFLLNKNTTDEIPEKPQGHYPTEVKQASGRIVRVVQAYAYTKYLGKLHLTFDSTGEIVKCDGMPILLNQKVPRDPVLLSIVDKYRSEIEKEYNVGVGSSAVTLYGDYCRLRECNIGDVITDAILNYTAYKGDYGINIALVQGGRIRASIDHPEKPFEMTKGDWITVLPFSDSLAVLTMNGSILRSALEHAVRSWRKIDSPGQFLQFSGMQVVYDLDLPPGSRVVTAKAVCSNCNNKLSNIEDDQEYRVTTCSFLAEGGDGFSMFEKLPHEVLSYSEVDAVLYHLKGMGLLKQKEDGRLIVLNEEKVKEPAEVIMNRFTGSHAKIHLPYDILHYISLVLALSVHF